MKYWAYDDEAGEEILTDRAGVKRAMRAHTQIEWAYFYHWAYGDCVECRKVSRAELLESNRDIERGATCQWAATHGGMR